MVESDRDSPQIGAGVSPNRHAALAEWRYAGREKNCRWGKSDRDSPQIGAGDSPNHRSEMEWRYAGRN